jgi:hypothetical protein
MTPPYWQEATQYLSNIDEVMAGLISAYPDEVLTNHHNPFHTLMRAVVGQHLLKTYSKLLIIKQSSQIGTSVTSLCGHDYLKALLM